MTDNDPHRRTGRLKRQKDESAGELEVHASQQSESQQKRPGKQGRDAAKKENKSEEAAIMKGETASRKAEERKQSNKKGPSGEDNERWDDSGRRKTGKERNCPGCVGIDEKECSRQNRKPQREGECRKERIGGMTE
jgi:hypothetical protein